MDRDGVINEYPGDTEYVKSWKEFRFLPGVKAALKRLNDNGYGIFVISNQAGVSKGIYSKGTLESITDNMLNELKKEEISILGVFYCTHRSEDKCSCRKPNTGLIEQAKKTAKDYGHQIDLEDSYFIGDTTRDVETGKAAGLKTILVFSGKEKPENKQSWQVLPDFTALNLSEAAGLVIKSK